MSRASLSLAGFQVTFIGRFWVTAEATGRAVSDEEMQRVNLKPNKFHGEWNYLIKPNRKTSG